jgi:hypothetical protein
MIIVQQEFVNLVTILSHVLMMVIVVLLIRVLTFLGVQTHEISFLFLITPLVMIIAIVLLVIIVLVYFVMVFNYHVVLVAVILQLVNVFRSHLLFVMKYVTMEIHALMTIVMERVIVQPLEMSPIHAVTLQIYVFLDFVPMVLV